MTINALRVLVLCAVWLTPSAAHAYVGPGAGISAIGSLLALIAAVLMSIVGFVWYPMKRLIKYRNKVRAEAAAKDRVDPS